jgi:hypothetical protein
MRAILIFLLLPLSAMAGIATVNLQTGEVTTRQPTEAELIAQAEQAATSAAIEADLEAQAADRQALQWVMLDDHPATNDIPAGGMTYRLSGDPITWWVVRQGDLEATQISAHDDAGRPIIRSRNLGTGNERTIHVGALEAAARVTVKATVTNEAALIELADIFAEWQSGMAVSVGDLYRFSGDLYRVIQGHTTQADWTPPQVPALFVMVAAPGVIAAWEQPYGGSGTYTNGAVVTYNGQTWVNTVAAPTLNVWVPGVYGWEPQ